MLPACLLLQFALTPLAQQPPERRTEVAGAVTVTNKGISFIPALTLGKPAGILDVAIWRGALSFEPQFRWGLDGKPWSYIFWLRFRSPTEQRLHWVVGAHPAVTFKTVTDSIDGTEIVVRRYVAGDVSPIYSVTRELDVAIYYFYGHGIDRQSIQNTHLIGARANLHNFGMGHDYTVQLAPQLYYLTMDGEDGVYVSNALTLGNRKFPLSISTLLNDPLHSEIAGGQEFIWNVSVTYSLR